MPSTFASRVDRDLELPVLVALVHRVGEILAPVLGPFDRAVEQLRRRHHRHVLGIDAELGAEAAADVGRDHAQALVEIHQRGQRLREVVRLLRRGMHGDAAVGARAPRPAMPRASIECAPPRCCHSSCLNTCAALAKAAFDVAELDLVGGDDVGVELAPHRRAVLRACARRRRTAAARSRRRPARRRPRRYSGRRQTRSPPARRHSSSRPAPAHRPRPCRAACRSWNAAPCGARPSPRARSSSVSTACTPGSASAASLSMLLISACGCGLRTNAACQCRARAMSSTKRPRPRSSGSSSRRVMREPMMGGISDESAGGRCPASAVR